MRDIRDGITGYAGTAGLSINRFSVIQLEGIRPSAGGGEVLV